MFPFPFLWVVGAAGFGWLAYQTTKDEKTKKRQKKRQKLARKHRKKRRQAYRKSERIERKLYQ